MKKLFVSKEFEKEFPLYIEQNEKELKNIKKLIKEKDFNQIYRIANKVKGASSEYGLEDIAVMLEKLEKIAIECNENMAKVYIQELLNYMDDIEFLFKDNKS